MIDLHCHVLPHMDDGSRSIEESLVMLETLAKQGVTSVAATSHFYAEENSLDTFLSRRSESVQRLRDVWRSGLPILKPGAEVCYFQGISQCEGLERLRIEGTQLLLLEMPFERWTRRALHEVWELQERPGVVVVLAHMERYLRWQEEDTWAALLERGVLSQCNASFFLNWRMRHRALSLLRDGRIHFLGSDSHNMETRPPRMGEAYSRLAKRDQELLNANLRRFLPDCEEYSK